MTDTGTMTEGSDLDGYRVKARTWIEANLERRSTGETGARGFASGHRTIEEIANERKIQRRMFDGGYSGISWPTVYGGQGLTTAHERIFNEEALKFRTPDFGAAGGTTFGVCGRTMLTHASPEFLSRHIPKILAGDELWVQFFSEPNAGSDLAGVITRAVKDGDRWILNGSKIWSSSAYFADYGMCLARTDWDVPKHRGLTWFAVKIDSPGVTVEPIRQINGSAEFCQEFFDDVELDASDVIGDVNQGWTVAQTMLVLERGGGERGAVVATERAAGRALAPDLVALARRLGRAKDPHVRQLIGRAHVNDFVHSELNSRLVRLTRSGAPNAGGLASYFKLAAGVFVASRARIGIEVGGGAGLVWDAGDADGMSASLNYLNGRVRAIAGGTNEMQRNAIGERVLGLPREPSFDTDRPFNEVVRNAAGWTGKVS
jgi:alkylation response protein AidB-like acyl-CoA dehydrogenase